MGRTPVTSAALFLRQAQDLKERMKDAALQSSPEYVFDVKGPGQVGMAKDRAR